MATQNYGEQGIEIHEDIPPVPTDQTGSSSSKGDLFNSGLFVSLVLIINVIQIVASLVGSWVSIVHGHPDHKIIAWLVVYASACAVMLPLVYSEYGPVRTQNPRLRIVMGVLWLTMSCFFLVWFVLGLVWVVSSHGGPILVLVLSLLFGCILYAVPAVGIATICLYLPLIILATLLVSPNENSGGASTPDSLSALPTCKFKSKQNGGRSGDEGGVVLAAGTKKERTLSGEDRVCCICLRKYVDNDELREVPCCSHFFHVGCLDKWLKIKARCPLCQSQLGVAGEAVTDATHSSHDPS